MKKNYRCTKLVALLFGLVPLNSIGQLVTQTVSYTGSLQTFTVPACVGQVTITAYGAQGANGVNTASGAIGGTGGLGAMATGVYTLSGSGVLNVYVGGAGTGSIGGFNGGGNGSAGNAGAGGGASDVRLNGTALSDRIIVAGGGGGGGNAGCASSTVSGGNGGSGGGVNGSSGVNSIAGGAGQGGSGSTGGAAGIGCSFALGLNGSNGTSGNGGAGGFGLSICGTPVSGGGGGGGFTGGGAGGGGSAGTTSCTLNDQGGGGGGAGGTNFFAPAFSGTSTSNNAQTGNGLVIISYSILPTPIIISSSTTICSGKSATLTASGATTYTWSNAQTGSVIVVSPTTTTSYTVTGSSITGCTNAAVSSVSVNVSPTVTVNSGSICSGQVFTIVASGANTYSYSIGSSTTAPLTNTTVSVTGTSTNGCVSAAAVSSITVATTPTITVNSGSVCVGKTFTMVPSGASTYTFSNGSNTVAPTTSTLFNVIGTSASGCASSTLTPAVSNITVVALPVVTVGGGTVCSGSPFIFQPSGASNYTFVNSSNPITPTVSGSYSVIGASNGCVSLPAVADVTVLALPNVAVAGTPTDMVVCQNSPISLTASGASTYTWNNTFVGATFSDTPQTTGNYFVIGTDNNGCTNLSNVPYTVNPQPALSVVTSNTFLCVGSSATLTANGGLTYSWTTGASSNTVVISPTVTTVYGVTATNTLNCSKTLSMSILVNTITLVVTANTAICQGTSIDLAASGAIAYSWTPGNSPFPTIQVSPNATSSYTVKGKDSKNCFHTAVITVTVNANPAVNASTSASVICAGESATLVASGANSYSWTSGSTTTNNDTLVVNPTNSFTYNYIVTGADANGCMGMDTVSVKVDKCVGINKVSAVVSEISVYPNPNNGEFVVELNNGLSKHIEISDLSGRIILTSTSSDDKTTVNLNAYAKGVYYVKVQSNTKVEVIKVIKH